MEGCGGVRLFRQTNKEGAGKKEEGRKRGRQTEGERVSYRQTDPQTKIGGGRQLQKDRRTDRQITTENDGHNYN